MADEKKEQQSAIMDRLLAALETATTTNQKLAEANTNPATQTLEQMTAKRLAELQGSNVPEPVTKMYPGCVSIITGALFDAIVINGKIVQIPNYQFPKGYDVPKLEGGLLPDGMSKGFYANDGTLVKDRQYKHYLWTNYWREDLRYYVGRHWPAAIANTVPTGVDPFPKIGAKAAE